MSDTSSGIVLVGIVDNLTGTDRATEFTGDGGPFYFLSNNFNFADSVTVVKGRSTFKFGGDYRVRQNSNFDGGRNGGTKGNYQYGTSNVFSLQNDEDGNPISIDRGFVSGNYNGIGPNDTGSSLANFLLGYSPGFPDARRSGGPFCIRARRSPFFVQDDWKVRPDLTLNLGLRYDIFTARRPNASTADQFRSGYQYGSTSRRRLARRARPRRNRQEPLRAAHRLRLRRSQATIARLRGGYVILYTTDVASRSRSPPTRHGASSTTQPITNPPARSPASRRATSSTLACPSRSARWPRPTFSSRRPRASALQRPEPAGRDVPPVQLDRAVRVCAELAGRTRLRRLGGQESAGAQQHRHGERSGRPRLARGDRHQRGGRHPLHGQFELQRDAGQAGEPSRGLRFCRANRGARHRDSPGGICSNGASARDCGPDNPLRPELERGNSDTDIRHRFTFANVYDLPLGRGRAYGGSMPAALDFLIGGFQLNNIISLQSGPVYNVTANGGRVDIIGDPTPTAADRAAGRQLNRAAFRSAVTPVFASDPGGPKIGTLGRNVFRGRQQFYWDASLFKNFPVRWISEDFRAQFRFSAYNVLNRVNRSFPNGDINNAGDFGRDTNEQRRRQIEFAIKLLF